MKEEKVSQKELFAKAILSDNIDEARKILYQIAGLCGEFPRRLIFIATFKNAQVLSPDGKLDYFPESQIQVLLERSEKGQLKAGGGKCIVLSVKLDGAEKSAYWIIYEDLKNWALELAPDLALIIGHIKNLEKALEREILIRSYSKLNSLFPALVYSENISVILKTLFPIIQDLYSPSLVVLGITTNKGVETAILDKGGVSAIRIVEEGVLPIGKTTESILNENDNVLKDLSTALKLPPFKRGFLVAKFEIRGFYSFILIGNPEKEPEPVFDLLRLFMAFLSTSPVLKRPSGKSAEDTSQLSEAFKMLAGQKERMDKVIRSLPTGVLLLTSQGEIEFSNPNVIKHLNITKVEISEKRLLRSKEPGKTIIGLLQKTEEENKPVTTPIQMEGKWIQLAISRLDENRLLIQSSDISSITKDMEERKHLFSLVTHEVKNPLAAVLSASELLYTRAADLKDEQISRLFEILYKNSKSMKDILEDVSQYGKSLLGTGSGASFALKPVILKIIEEKAAIAKSKDITIISELDEIVIFEQAGMVETLLSNLIGNAVKYTGFAGHIGVKLAKLADKAVLEVIDDGAGIPAGNLSRIGEAFFRADNIKENYAGTGLGLMIVKNIVSHMRGTFKILSPILKEDRMFIGDENNSRRGTKIVIVFPIIGGGNAEQDSGR
jgi:signal transduction histidine kinase